MKKRLLSIVTALIMVCSFVGVVPKLEMRVEAAKLSVNEIVARADELYNLTWTPLKTIYGYGKNYTFYAGKTYRIPYGMPVDRGGFIGYTIGVYDFINQTKNPNSKLYTSSSGYSGGAAQGYKNAWYCPYYAMDCSTFVSYCWGLSTRQTTSGLPSYSTNIGKCNSANVGKIQIGDALNSSGHVKLVTDVSNGVYEITEQAPDPTGQLYRATYTAAQLVANNSNYYILRYADSVPPPIPDDVTERYRVSTSSGANLMVRSTYSTSGSIITQVKNGTEFDISQKVNNWGYCIAYGGWLCLDYCTKISAPKPTNPNVSISKRLYRTGEQITFNFSANNATGYTIGIDDSCGKRIDTTTVSGSSYTRTFDTIGDYSCYVTAYNNAGYADSARIYFEIFKPLDYGDSFSGLILNKNCRKPIMIDDNDNIVLGTENAENMRREIWKFTKNSDGSYRIWAYHNGKSLDVYNGDDADETSILTWEGHDGNNQKWFICQADYGIMLRPASSQTRVLDLKNNDTSDGTPIQLYTRNDTYAQKFDIYKFNQPTASTFSVTPGTSYSNTKFTWTKSDYADKYTAKIWKDKLWEGPEYKAYSTTGTSWNITLPEGTYHAYVDSANKYNWQTSNIVTFTVKKGTCTHSYGSWTTSKAATCTADGSKTRKCSICGKTETQTIAKTAHKFTSKTANGNTTYTCSSCKYSYKVTFEGKGTAESPYLIANKEDLYCLAGLINNIQTADFFRTKCYKQTADIDLKNEKWIPMGKFKIDGKETGCYFSSGFVYDGANHSIFNMNVNEASGYTGFIGKVNFGTVKNLAVYGNVSSTSENGEGTAGIVGEVGYMGKVLNCSFNGNVSSDESSGGIVGHVWRGATIENCYHNGTVTGGKWAGGIVGLALDKNYESEIHTNIKNCYHLGKVTGPESGGIVGKHAETGTLNEKNTLNIINSYFLSSSATKGLGVGTITKNESTAIDSDSLKSLAKKLGGTYRDNSHPKLNDGYPVFEWQFASNGHKYTTKVLAPTCTAKGYTEYTCSACKHTYTDTEKAALGHKFTSKTENGNTTYTCSACKLTYKVTFEGKGTADSPYLIENKEDLFCLANLINNTNTASFFRTKCYKQTANIDLKNGKWTPLGTYVVNGKSGVCYMENGFVYDGNNHNIYNMNVNETSGYTGFIGKLNFGTVKNLSVHGNVSSTGAQVGGIVGELGYMGTIENCSFNGNVKGNSLVGGIVGHIWRGGNVINCYHNGTITAEKIAGGIVGFIQYKDYETELHSNVTNCYHIGDISGTTIGGIVGRYAQSGTLNANNTANIKNCYFLKSSAENGLGEGKITKNDSTPLISGMLKEIAVDLGSSFGSNKHEAINNGYPAFKWQLPSKVKGDINNDGKIQIADAVKVQKALSKVQIVTAADAIASDVNEDGKFNVFDLIIIKRMLLNS